MKKTILLSIIALIQLASGFQLQNCETYNVGYGLFDLCGFSEGNPFYYNASGNNLTFSLGNNDVNDCSDLDNIWGTYQTQLNCYNVAVQSPTYSLINSSDSSQGIVITFPSVQQNISHNSAINWPSYQLIVNLSCDASDTDIDQIQFTMSEQSADNNTEVIFTLTGSSSAACPIVSLDTVVNFFSQNKAIFAGAFGFLGLVLLVFGFRLMTLAVFLIPTLLTGLGLAYLLFAIITVSELWGIYAIMGGSLLIGIIIGVIALVSPRFAYFFIGAAVGVVIGFLVYNAILSPFIKDFYGVAPLYCTLGVSGLIGGGIGICLFESILILATCSVGSFLVVRAAAEFIGGFPAENAVAEGLEQFNLVTYAYLTFIILIAGIGIYLQVKQKRMSKSKKSSKPGKKQEGDDGTETGEDVYSTL